MQSRLRTGHIEVTGHRRSEDPQHRRNDDPEAGCYKDPQLGGSCTQVLGPHLATKVCYLGAAARKL